jgi:hypothetical protein
MLRGRRTTRASEARISTPAAGLAALFAAAAVAACQLITELDYSKIGGSGGSGGASTSSTAGSGGGPGTGGADGGAACMQASDCPGKDTDCQVRVCNMGVCAVSYPPRGVSTSTQTAGTCQQNVCDGAGGVVSIPDDENPPASNSPCTLATCSCGEPSFQPLPAGTACTGADGGADGGPDGGGPVCDGNGSCVG